MWQPGHLSGDGHRYPPIADGAMARFDRFLSVGQPTLHRYHRQATAVITVYTDC
jgi:hypothetical protein